jgi:two-component system, LytTR family, sensor kinase
MARIIAVAVCLGQTARCSQMWLHGIALPAQAAGSRIEFMHDNPTSGQSRSWGWSGALYLGIGLLDAGQTVFTMHTEGMHHAWLRLFATQALSWLPWAIATPVVFRLADRLERENLRNPLIWCVHIAAVLGIGLVAALWTAGLLATLHPFAPDESVVPFRELWIDKFLGAMLGNVVLYAFVLTIRHMLDQRERLATETARLNEQLATAQLEALRRQIEPHFLFNSLNAITGLVRENKNDTAVSSIVQLSDFLRRIVSQPPRAEVSLQSEVELTQLYLHVQQLRFAERLQTSLDVPEQLLHAQVPSLLLQPLVENAIKHGITKRARGGLIRVAVSRNDTRLNLSVYNDGPALTATPSSGNTGVGISNLRARLKILYGEASALILRNEPPDGVQVLVTVPYRES